MDLDRLNETFEQLRSAHDDAIDEVQELLGEHAAFHILADAFFDLAPLNVREQVLLPLHAEFKSLQLPEDDVYRRTFVQTIMRFVGQLPPTLPE